MSEQSVPNTPPEAADPRVFRLTILSGFHERQLADWLEEELPSMLALVSAWLATDAPHGSPLREALRLLLADLAELSRAAGAVAQGVSVRFESLHEGERPAPQALCLRELGELAMGDGGVFPVSDPGERRDTLVARKQLGLALSNAIDSLTYDEIGFQRESAA